MFIRLEQDCIFLQMENARTEDLSALGAKKR